MTPTAPPGGGGGLPIPPIPGLPVPPPPPPPPPPGGGTTPGTPGTPGGGASGGGTTTPAGVATPPSGGSGGAGAVPAGGTTSSGSDGGGGQSGGSGGSGTTPGGGSSAPSGGLGGGGTASPGGGAPGAPAGVTGGGGATPRNKKATSFEGALSWDWWWTLNRERFLNLRANLRRDANTTPNELMGDIDPERQARARARRMRLQIAPLLRRAVREEDARIRSAALVALGKVGHPGKSSDMIPYLATSNLAVTESGIIALGLLGDDEGAQALADIAADTKAGRKILGTRSRIGSDVRSIAAVSLGLACREGCASPEHGTRTLLDLVKGHEKNAAVNVAAALGLGVMAAPEAVPELIEVLEDESRDAYLRANVASTLGKLGERSAMPVLLKGLKDRDTQVRRSAALALGLLASPEDKLVVKALMKSARSGADQCKRNFAVISLGEIGGPDARNFLLKLVRKGSVFEKGFGALALGIDGWKSEHEDRDAVAEVLMRELANNKTCRIRGACIIGLGLLGHSDAADEIEKVVNIHGHADLRIYGCLSLGLLKSKKSTPTLHRALIDRGSCELRTAASIGLGLIGDKEATKILTGTLHDDAGGAIRGAALRGIGLIGDVEVILGLGKILDDAKSEYPGEIRAFAATALGLLGDREDVPALSLISEDINYAAQRGVLVKLLGRF